MIWDAPTGNMGILLLDSFGGNDFSMTAVDNSPPMIEKYRNRLKAKDGASRIKLVCAGMTDITIENASVVIINLTLQFLAPEQRDGLIKALYDGLEPGGVLLLTEKITSRDGDMARLEQEFYMQFKRENGYSELEISQKRDALEKVLIPEPVEIHEQRLKEAGFNRFDVWLKWFNFTSMLAVKA